LGNGIGMGSRREGLASRDPRRRLAAKFYFPVMPDPAEEPSAISH